jgi:hypothetical protein
MKYWLMTMLLVLVGNFSIAQSKDVVEIKAMLKQQENAWNEGNLEKFMIGYWKSDSLLFIGKNGPKYGYQTTLATYKKGYADTTQMGKFTSTIISMQKLSSNNYFVVGKWFLKRTIGNVQGHYTLLIRKLNNKWVIVADHSS